MFLILKEWISKDQDGHVSGVGHARSLVTRRKDQGACLAAGQYLLHIHLCKAALQSFLMLGLVSDGFSTKMIHKPLYFFLKWFDRMLPFSFQCQAMGLGLIAYFLPSGVLWNKTRLPHLGDPLGFPVQKNVESVCLLENERRLVTG